MKKIKNLLTFFEGKVLNYSMAAAQQIEYRLVARDEMENFMERCMLAAGSVPAHAKALASCLIAGDHRGHFSHGLNRLGQNLITFFRFFCFII